MNDSKVKRQFTWEIATWMAKLSMHAYQKESNFKKAMKPLGSWKVRYFDFGGTQAYALNGKKNFVLVFRGTQETSQTRHGTIVHKVQCRPSESNM